MQLPAAVFDAFESFMRRYSARFEFAEMSIVRGAPVLRFLQANVELSVSLDLHDHCVTGSIGVKDPLESDLEWRTRQSNFDRTFIPLAQVFAGAELSTDFQRSIDVRSAEQVARSLAALGEGMPWIHREVERWSAGV